MFFPVTKVCHSNQKPNHNKNQINTDGPPEGALGQNHGTEGHLPKDSPQSWVEKYRTKSSSDRVKQSSWLMVAEHSNVTTHRPSKGYTGLKLIVERWLANQFAPRVEE